MSAPTRCVICLNHLKSKKKLIPRHSVEEQTLIMYFLRKLAWTQIPEDDLKTFLKVGNPSEWASFCYICEEEVKKCYDMHRKIREMIEKISEIRRKLYQENFYESDDEDMGDKSSGSCGGGVMNIFNKLREQLFSDFKEEGGDSWKFDNSIMITYKTSKDLERTPTVPSSKGDIKTETASDDEYQDFEYQEEEDSASEEETSRADSRIAYVADDAKPLSSTTKIKVKVKPDEILNEKPGLLEKFEHTSWSLMEISEETIKDDYRVDRRSDLKGGHQTMYYCAYGVPTKKCPVRLRVKTLRNGVCVIHTNNKKHCNHRGGIRGITEEQKQFVINCIERGVTKPLDIMHSFRESDVEEPDKGRLQSYLNRERNKLVATAKDLKRDPGQILGQDESDKSSDISQEPRNQELEINPGNITEPKEDHPICDQQYVVHSSSSV